MTFGVWFGGSHLGFGTHMPILASAVLQARPGPVLEYGVGFYSSPLLHLLCEEMGRGLLSMDHDPAWLERFGAFRSDTHRMLAYPNWAASEAVVDAETWAVAFIDHGPNDRRVVDARRIADKTEFVIVHDWEAALGDPLPEYQQAIADHFEHMFVSRCGPRTAVLSNFRQFKLGCY
jgi:hypothetical protein